MARLCKKCGGPGPFHKKHGTSDGLASRCKACENARTQQWRQDHPDIVRVGKRRWQLSRPEHVRDMNRLFRETHPNYLANWCVVNLNKRRRYRSDRSNVFAQVEQTLTILEWSSILEVFGHRCAYCLRGDVKLTMDHVHPVSRGGPHTSDNVVPACVSCNSKKGARPILWMAGCMV